MGVEHLSTESVGRMYDFTSRIDKGLKAQKSFLGKNGRLSVDFIGALVAASVPCSRFPTNHNDACGALLWSQICESTREVQH